MDEERLAAIEEAIGILAEKMLELCEKVDWHDKQLDEMNGDSMAGRLKELANDFGSMVGGFSGILADRKKSRITDMLNADEGLGGYKDRYAKTFKSDLIGDAVESILSQMEQQGQDESAIPGIVEQLKAELKSRFDEEQAEPDSAAHEAAESPAEETAEHEPGGSEAEGKPKALEIEVKTGDIPPELAAEARRFRGQRPA